MFFFWIVIFNWGKIFWCCLIVNEEKMLLIINVFVFESKSCIMCILIFLKVVKEVKEWLSKVGFNWNIWKVLVRIIFWFCFLIVLVINKFFFNGK